jgi:hypothetical protein
LLLPSAVIALVLFFAVAVNNLDGGRAAEDRRQLEESLRRSCVACYAAEGAYPPSLEYLEEHYGLQINKTRYTVCYSAFAENLMPDITVLESEP